MEEPSRLDKLYNFPAKDILVPSLKVGALSGKAIFHVYGILHTLLYHQHPAFVLVGILTVQSLLFALISFPFRLHYMCRRMTTVLGLACNPLSTKLRS